jgi:hypothetical protein
MFVALRSRHSIRNERRNLAILAVLNPANADAASKTWIVLFVRLRIGRINDVFGVDENPARAAVLPPFFEIGPVLVEDLNPAIGAVAYEQASFGIEGKRVRRIELARAGAFLAPSFDELAGG